MRTHTIRLSPASPGQYDAECGGKVIVADFGETDRRRRGRPEGARRRRPRHDLRRRSRLRIQRHSNMEVDRAAIEAAPIRNPPDAARHGALTPLRSAILPGRTAAMRHSPRTTTLTTGITNPAQPICADLISSDGGIPRNVSPGELARSQHPAIASLTIDPVTNVAAGIIAEVGGPTYRPAPLR